MKISYFISTMSSDFISPDEIKIIYPVDFNLKQVVVN